jgi:hypothetical protein
MTTAILITRRRPGWLQSSPAESTPYGVWGGRFLKDAEEWCKTFKEKDDGPSTSYHAERVKILNPPTK